MTQSLKTASLNRIVEVKPYLFLATSFSSGKVKVYDRKNQATTDVKVGTSKKGFSDIVMLSCYDAVKFPFVLLKSGEKMHALNTVNWQSYELAKIYDV